MRLFVVDAFNLFHAIPELEGSAAPHADLIAFLKSGRFTGSRANRVILVFDGHADGSTAGEREFELLFSRHRTADETIRDFVLQAPHKGQITVVSDDRAVQGEAKGAGAGTISTATFLAGGKNRASAKTPPEKPILDKTTRDRITAELERQWVKVQGIRRRA